MRSENLSFFLFSALKNELVEDIEEIGLLWLGLFLLFRFWIFRGNSFYPLFVLLYDLIASRGDVICLKILKGSFHLIARALPAGTGEKTPKMANPKAAGDVGAKRRNPGERRASFSRKLL